MEPTSNALSIASSNWGGAGVFIGVIFAAWFARRLRWWLLLFIPIIIVLMVPIALIYGDRNGWTCQPAVGQVNDCQGVQDLSADLVPISAGMKAFIDDINSTTNPGVSDMRRWSASANTIEQQYEALDHPPVFDRYVQLSIQTLANYEAGFAAYGVRRR